MPPIKNSFDTETGGLQWYEPAQHAFLTTWSDQRGNDHLAHQGDARAMAAFQSDMRRCDVLEAHNLPFDVHQIRESPNGFDILKLGKRLVDTAVHSKVVWPDRYHLGKNYKLKGLAEDHVDPNAKDSEDAMKELARRGGFALREKGGYLRAWHEDSEIVETYAKMDTRLTRGLADAIEAATTEKLRPTIELETQVQPHLIRAEARGVRVDQEKVQALLPSWLEKRDRNYDAVVKVLGPDALGDPDDPEDKDDADVMRAKLQAAGVPLYRTTDSGLLTTAAWALKEFEDDFPWLKSLSEYRTARKFLQTYMKPLIGRDTVHPSIWQLGAWTGRMSMSNPNMQNIPVRGEGSSELREMFIPREDHVFVVSDFDQIELRLLAYYLDDAEFQAKVASGWDAFAELAATIAAMRPDLVPFGTDPANYRKGTPGAQWRGYFKNVTYAITYGAGGGKIHNMIPGLDPGEPLGPDAWTVQRGYAKVGDPSYAPAREIINLVKSWLPGYGNLMDRPSRYRPAGRVVDKVMRDGYVSTINGRRQAVNPDKSYVGLNALIQGSAADIFKIAVCLVAERTAHLGSMPVLFVHDEIGSECPREVADEVLKIQDQAMMDAWDLNPPLSCSGTIAVNNYAEAK
jgi:DNA polymerase-1